MSYYSDVKCVMYEKDFDIIRNKIDMLDLGEDSFYRDIFWNKLTEISFNGVVVLSWETFNHWDSCTNIVVECFEKCLYEMEEKERPFKFIRLGEGAGDGYEDIETIEYIPNDLKIIGDIDIIEVRREITMCNKFKI